MALGGGVSGFVLSFRVFAFLIPVCWGKEGKWDCKYLQYTQQENSTQANFPPNRHLKFPNDRLRQQDHDEIANRIQNPRRNMNIEFMRDTMPRESKVPCLCDWLASKQLEDDNEDVKYDVGSEEKVNHGSEDYSLHRVSVGLLVGEDYAPDL